MSANPWIPPAGLVVDRDPPPPPPPPRRIRRVTFRAEGAHGGLIIQPRSGVAEVAFSHPSIPLNSMGFADLSDLEAFAKALLEFVEQERTR